MRERVHARKSHRHAENDASRGGRAPEAGGKKGPAVKTRTDRILSLQHTAGNAAVAALIGE